MINLRHLPGMRSDEQTVFLLRRHWFVIIPLLIGFGIILVLPFITYAVVNIQNPDFFSIQTNLTLYILGGSLFFLFAWLFLFQNFIDWYLDVWIVTTYRIVNIEQHGLFGRTMSELMLYNVQDVTSDVRGFIPTMFDFGTISIQTAGETKRFDFEHIEHPTLVAKRVLELADIQRVEHQRRGNQAVGTTY